MVHWIRSVTKHEYVMTEFEHKEFGNQLRRWRQSLQPPMTQRTLARQIGVSDGFLAHIETGRTLPGIRTLQALAKALGVSEAEMLSAAGYLTRRSEIPDETLLKDPELRLFFRDDCWGQYGIYQPCFPTKFMSEDGLRMAMVSSGTYDDYNFTFQRLTLEIEPAHA